MLLATRHGSGSVARYKRNESIKTKRPATISLLINRLQFQSGKTNMTRTNPEVRNRDTCEIRYSLVSEEPFIYASRRTD